MNNNIAILYSTTPTEQDANTLANIALSSKLAVCVNIFPKGKSMYLWEGKIEKSEEYYVIFKTTIDLIDKLENIIIENHPYDIPAILKWEANANTAFYKYMEKELESERK